MRGRRKKMKGRNGRTKVMREASDDHHRAAETSRMPFRFFKLVLPAVIEQKKLRIPAEFARKFSDELFLYATLTVPTGASWKVTVTTSDNWLYFHDGWSTFMEQNQIENGYFLEFEYLGHRRFNVRIINLACSEIDYPRSTSSHAQTRPREPQHQHHANYLQRHDRERSIQVEEEDEDEQYVYEPSFPVTVRKSYLIYLHIPQLFAEKYLTESVKVVKLRGDDGEWEVECYKAWRGGFRFTGAGWRNFTEENNWLVDDEYTFTMVIQNSNYMVFQVTKK